VGNRDGQQVRLIKPTTYMNRSGAALAPLRSFPGFDPASDLLVLVDDVALPTGKFRLRGAGSAGGHNGLKSIIQELGTDEFLRIRLGIEPITPFKGSLEDYVLGKISDEEMDLMEKNIWIYLPCLSRDISGMGLQEPAPRLT